MGAPTEQRHTEGRQAATGPTERLEATVWRIRAARLQNYGLLILLGLGTLMLTLGGPPIAPEQRALTIGISAAITLAALAAQLPALRSTLDLSPSELRQRGLLGSEAVALAQVRGMSLRSTPERYGAVHRALVIWGEEDQTLLVLNVSHYRQSDLCELIGQLSADNPHIQIEQTLREHCRGR